MVAPRNEQEWLGIKGGGGRVARMKKWIKLQISVTTHCHTYYSNIIMTGGMEKGNKKKKKETKKKEKFLPI